MAEETPDQTPTPLGRDLLWVSPDDALFSRVTALAGPWTRAVQARETAAAVSALNQHPFSVVVLDRRAGPGADWRLLDQICAALAPAGGVLLLCRSGDGAEEGLRRGAADSLVEPIDAALLAAKIQELTQQAASILAPVGAAGKASQRRVFCKGFLVGTSPGMLRVFDQIERMARSAATVIIRGESGTGKELVAQTLHSEGDRRAAPLVAVNCAAVPEALLESELFGHERGAFTGAAAQRAGCFEQAHGGTLFLDEVGDLPLEAQAKLLRVLESRSVRRVGGQADIPVDVRVIAATHRELETMVVDGRFREDLYFRLNVYSITIPPLRERPEDVVLLAVQFLSSFRRREQKPIQRLGHDAVDRLLAYHWPGNVRELRNVIHRAVLYCDASVLEARHIPRYLLERRDGSAPEPDLDLPQTTEILPLAQVEARAIAAALEVTGGNVSEAARRLQISRDTLYRKIHRYELRRGPGWPPTSGNA